MNKRIVKIISLILVLSIFISALSLSVFAIDSENDSSKDTFDMRINRTFDEGWDAFNGLRDGLDGNLALIDYEERADFSRNHFLRLERAVETGGYVEPSFQTTVYDGEAVMEFDIKIDGITDLGTILYILTTSSSGTRTFANLLAINDNVLTILNGNFKIGSPTEWLHIAIVFELDYPMVKCINCGTEYEDGTVDVCEKSPHCTKNPLVHIMPIRYYFGNASGFDAKCAVDLTGKSSPESLDGSYYVDTYQSINTNYKPSMYLARIGTMGTSAETLCQSFCIDNFRFYSDPNPKDKDGNPTDMLPKDDVSPYGYGSGVNENATKTVDLGNGEEITDPTKSGMILKVGSNYMLYRGERAPIYVDALTEKTYGAPIKQNGTVYMPLELLLDFSGYPIFRHTDGLTVEISTENGSSVLTMGRTTALIDGERTALYAPPMMYTDESVGITYPVISINDVNALFDTFFVTYDEMGLIAICSKPDVFKRESDLDYMLELMKKFIFDYYDGEEMYRLLETNTNGFDHPYLMCDDETFGYMHSVYTGEIENESYKAWLTSFVNKMEESYEKYTTLPDPEKVANHTYLTRPERFDYLAFEITNPHDGIKDGLVWSDSSTMVYVSGPDENGEYWPSVIGGSNNGKDYNNGLDFGNRNYQCFEYYGEMIRNLALAYRITEEERFARLTYELLISFTDDKNWPHWCDIGEFLITSETGTAISLAYDWCYDAFSLFDDEYYEIKLGNIVSYDLDYIAQEIYERVIIPFYDKTNGGTTSFAVWKINWNAVCTTGTVISALAIAGETGDSIDYDREDGIGDLVLWTLENPIKTLTTHGLDLYAPDGSYIESPGYWEFATNNLSMLMWAIDTSIGDDLGFFELWGIDKTYYYAIQTEFSHYTAQGYSYALWGYHDGGTSAGAGQNTSLFLFASQMLSDKGLAAIRLDQIKNGKGVAWTDIIGYKPEYDGLSLSDASLSRDYLMEACEAAVGRSSWEPGALYTGIMGNGNSVTDHGQIDSGNFVYANGGYYWFSDLGADRYNVYKYFGHAANAPRYKYYRNIAEGQNLVLLTSRQSTMPHGQSWDGGGVIESFHSEEAGMYSVLDNTSAYGGYASDAKRGLLLTNNRTTTVIQDEISFKGMEIAVWVAHTQAGITLSDDRRTAFLQAKVGDELMTLRVSIVSEEKSYKFQTMTAGISESDFLLDATNRPSYSTDNGGLAEYGRTSYKRLIIKTENTMNFRLAVVIEPVATISDDTPVGYSFTAMNSWEISEAPSTPPEGNEQSDDIITNALLGHIKTNTEAAIKMFNSGYALDTRVLDFYRALVRVQAAVNTYRPDVVMLIPEVNKYYQQYLVLLNHYNSYKNAIDRDFEYTLSIARNIILSQ